MLAKEFCVQVIITSVIIFDFFTGPELLCETYAHSQPPKTCPPREGNIIFLSSSFFFRPRLILFSVVSPAVRAPRQRGIFLEPCPMPPPPPPRDRRTRARLKTHNSTAETLIRLTAAREENVLVFLFCFVLRFVSFRLSAPPVEPRAGGGEEKARGW